MKIVKTILFCVLLLGVAAGAIWTLDHFKSEPVHTTPAVSPRLVTSMVVHTTSKRIDVTTQGTVKPRHEIDLVAQVAGEAKSIADSLRNGGFFAKHDVLVQLDARDYELEVTRAAAQVAQAELTVSWEEAEAEIARREWKAMGKGKPTPLTLREPQVLEAKARLAAAKAVLAKANLALERTTIRAPFAGRVRTSDVDTGQFVGLGTKLARIYAVDFAEVRLPLHDSQLRYLDLPLSYRGATDATPGPEVTLQTRFAQQTQQWTARIVRTEGELDARSRMVHAIARVEDPYGRKAEHQTPLAVGMFVEAIIHGREFDNVIEIPRDAVRDDGEVLVIDDENRMHRRAIRLLHRGAHTVIVDEGLRDGERICLSSIAVFIDNMPVTLAARSSSNAMPGNAKPGNAKPGNGGQGR